MSGAYKGAGKWEGDRMGSEGGRAAGGRLNPLLGLFGLASAKSVKTLGIPR